ncbi:sulfurtransferase TusA family protein [Alphaproteobacteria bacterium]|jgi:tRNA 2-thiouridine synthesizing protein A|nr:sulfurtransferase TusA family protein [Alphaproteobacteria bacterium]
MMTETQLDVTGHKCPLPVLKAKKALKTVEVGAMLKVLVTDPSAPKDFRAFCETAGHNLIEESKEGEITVLLLQKGEAA